MQCYRGIFFRKELAVVGQKLARNYLLANDAKKSAGKYLNSEELQRYSLEKRINCTLCILGNKDLTQAGHQNIDNIIIISEHTQISLPLSLFHHLSTKGRFQKRFSVFCPLRGGVPPLSAKLF